MDTMTAILIPALGIDKVDCLLDIIAGNMISKAKFQLIKDISVYLMIFILIRVDTGKRICRTQASLAEERAFNSWSSQTKDLTKFMLVIS